MTAGSLLTTSLGLFPRVTAAMEPCGKRRAQEVRGIGFPLPRRGQRD